MEKNQRKPNVDLNGYSKLINPKILEKVANRRHTMAKMPYYSKKGEPEKLHEEEIIESRYKSLSDSYSNTFNVDKQSIGTMNIMMNAGSNGMAIMRNERPKREELVKLVENIIRSEYNMDKDEILFDLEIVDIGGCSLPEEMDVDKKVEDEFEQTDDYDILKKRTINALSQGAALSSHYIFHLYKDEFEEIIPQITQSYQKALIANDLFYFILNDDDLQNQLSGGDSGSNAGYCRLNFDGDIPVIEAKAISAPILLHEVTKCLITFFSIPGIQNMDQETVDETDFVMAELWDIRFGPTIWTNFHSIIDVDDYDIKKLIIMEIFKMDSITFIDDFMKKVMNDPELAKKEVKYIVKKIRNQIMEYEFEKDSDDVDLSDFGIF
jgi:hypothetical protein